MTTTQRRRSSRRITKTKLELQSMAFPAGREHLGALTDSVSGGFEVKFTIEDQGFTAFISDGMTEDEAYEAITTRLRLTNEDFFAWDSPKPSHWA